MMRHPSRCRAVLSAAALLLLLCCIGCARDNARGGLIPAQPFLHHALGAPDEWYKSDDGRQFCDNLVTWQNANGGWWKKYDPRVPRPAELPPPATDDAPPGDTEGVWRRTSTFDNDATYSEMRILARAYRLVGKPTYRAAFERGLQFMLDAQYPSGGWPQRFPLENNYGREITFNDNAMTNVMTMLRDVADGRGDVSFVEPPVREKCRAAFNRGVECTLNLQIKINGKLTAWAQQYDDKTFRPAKARAYELPSISADESEDIAILLMDLPHPSDRVRTAIASVAGWYSASKITGKRVATVSGPQYENGKDRVLVDDPSAPPLWARFYDIESDKPFFVSRDGVKRDAMSEISWERRNHYSWYGTWGKNVLDHYADWKKRVGDETK